VLRGDIFQDEPAARRRQRRGNRFFLHGLPSFCATSVNQFVAQQVPKAVIDLL